jgi:uncharacterized repeat protein (TIGR04138 family)
MLDPNHPLARLLREDRRYPIEAYQFVFEALAYAHDTLGWGRESASESEPDEPDVPPQRSSRRPAAGGAARRGPVPERHVTGQELCEAIRRYALEQFGYMAKTVFHQWGIRSTSDFGEIVYNLIRIRQMRKTPDDRREHFDNVFDFDRGLVEAFRFNGTI